jgi:hypothetical protein
MAGVIENYSKFEVHVVVRFFQAEEMSWRDSSQVSECVQLEGNFCDITDLKMPELH